MEDKKQSIHVTITNGGTKTHKKVSLDSFVIGRHADCDVNVLHPQVSRQHLKITIQGQKLFFEDMGSSNGTYINQKRLPVKKVFPMDASDIIQLGEDGPTIQAHIEIPAPPPKMPESLPGQPVVAQFVPPAPSKESNKSLVEANKQALQILQQAEIQVEAKAQTAYKQAVAIEEKAEKQFQERMKAANEEAQKIFEETREESLKLLQETRTQTQALRDQAEKDARELRQSTEEKCIEILKDAETQGFTVKTKRLAEADEIIAKQGQELLKATYEKIEREKTAALTQLDSLKAKTSKARIEMEDAEAEKLEIAKNLAETKREMKIQQDDYESRKSNYEKIKADEKSTLSHIELMKKELAELEKSHSKSKVELEKVTVALNSMKQEKEDKETEMTAQLQVLKGKIEDEKAQITQKEADRSNELKVQTAEAIKKFEKELIEEMLSKKNQMAKELLLQVETLCPTVALNDDWKSKRSEMYLVFQCVIGICWDDCGLFLLFFI